MTEKRRWQINTPDRAHPVEISRYGDVIEVDLAYPRNEGAVNAIEVGLMDVRAADSIQVSYDFERDGWVIKQSPSTGMEDDWQEVAFCQAWALREDVDSEAD